MVDITAGFPGVVLRAADSQATPDRPVKGQVFPRDKADFTQPNTE